MNFLAAIWSMYLCHLYQSHYKMSFLIDLEWCAIILGWDISLTAVPMKTSRPVSEHLYIERMQRSPIIRC